MASDDAVLTRLFFYDNPEYKRHPNNTKTDQIPISEVITGLPRPYHHNCYCFLPGTMCLSCLCRGLCDHRACWIPTIPAIRFLYRLLWAHQSSKKGSKLKFFLKQPEKKNHGQMLGQDRPEKTPPNVNSKRRDSESSTDIDRQHQRLRHEIWTVVTAVFTQRPVVRDGRRPGVWYKHTSAYLGAAV